MRHLLDVGARWILTIGLLGGVVALAVGGRWLWELIPCFGMVYGSAVYLNAQKRRLPKTPRHRRLPWGSRK